MAKFRVYQTMFLGTIEVPEGIKNENNVIEYMNKNDNWPEEFLEPIETIIKKDGE